MVELLQPLLGKWKSLSSRWGMDKPMGTPGWGSMGTSVDVGVIFRIKGLFLAHVIIFKQ